MTLTEIRSLQNQQVNFAETLAESKEWAPFLEGISDRRIKGDTAVMLENTRQYFEGLDETTRASQIGDFEKFAFPLIRAIFPELIAQRICSVQPMMGPTSLIFYLAFVFATNKGNVAQGQQAFGSQTLGTSNPGYTSPTINGESLGAGNNSTATNYTGTFQFIPLLAGRLTIVSTGTDGTVIIDDGNGNLLDAGTTVGTVNYATGAYSFETTTAVATTAFLSATYDYNMEAQANLPEMDMNLTSAPVVAAPRKLRAKWSMESAFNLRSLHGLDADVELMTAMGSEIRFEIDRAIINDITNQVPTTGANPGQGGTNNQGNLAPAWSLSKRFNLGDTYSTATGATDTVGLNEHNLSLINQFTVGDQLIFGSTGRATGSFVVAGLNVMNIMETLPNFTVNQVPNGLTKGPYLAGRLGSRWDVIKDPFYTSNAWMMGYKGPSFLETGYVYAPYIPLYTTPTITLDDFISRKAIATQYATKMVNPNFYAKGLIVA